MNDVDKDTDGLLTKSAYNIKLESLAFQSINLYQKLLKEEAKEMKEVSSCKSSEARSKVDKYTVTRHCGLYCHREGDMGGYGSPENEPPATLGLPWGVLRTR